MITCGFELEVSSGADNTLAHLNEMGLTGHDYLHEYHCGCDECDPHDSDYLFKAQEDCTADGEFITRVLTYGSVDMDRAILGLSRALLMGGASTSGDVGNHVHVSHEDMDVPARNRLCRLFARYETSLTEIAAADKSGVRTYNGVTAQYSDRIWHTTASRPDVWSVWEFAANSKLTWKDPTVEFRLWNSTRAAWRIRTHVGLSVAMVLAATDGVDTDEDDPRCLEDVISEYIDAPTWAGILRQRFSKGGLA